MGTLLMIGGLIAAGVSVSYLTDAERAPGTVVSLEWRNDTHSGSRKQRANDGPTAYPVVEFTSADGTPRTFRSSAGSNPPSYERGEQVEVLYLADSPDDARINGFTSLWLLPVILGGIGLVMAGIGTTIAITTRRRS
ncbi:DUF3592 domain-containing protein [Streptomyces sp. NPDC056486]|uniref:DUF3592 domain-containing protein n=1 Tax=Streptomyces sp. NPDC056486 TaxID=3345835 RepID=UPI0036777EDD